MGHAASVQVAVAARVRAPSTARSLAKLTEHVGATVTHKALATRAPRCRPSEVALGAGTHPLEKKIRTQR